MVTRKCEKGRMQLQNRFLVAFLCPSFLVALFQLWRGNSTFAKSIGPISSNSSNILLVTAVFSSAAANKRYLRVFLETAANSGSDVLIIGDTTPPYPLPGTNIRHYKISWSSFLETANQKLFDGRPVLNGLRNASQYKVVEFKPMFAFLFPELVEGYEWWGHCDVDMVLGNVPKLLNDYLATNDILSVSPDHASVGPFQLYRNTHEINTLFLRGFENKTSGIGLQQILTYPHYVGFDEWGQESPWGANSTPSMSSIIAELQPQMGLRVQKGLPELVYDGFCRSPLPNPTWNGFGNRYPRPDSSKDCAECIYANDQLFVLEADNSKQPVLACHYQFGKALLEQSLASGGTMDQLLEQGAFRVSYTHGYRPI